MNTEQGILNDEVNSQERAISHRLFADSFISIFNILLTL